VAGGEREQPLAGLALAAERVGQVLAAPGADLDLAADELAGDRVGQDRVVGRRVAQLLEARHELECVRVKERELLLEPDREVGGVREGLRGAVRVDRHVGGST
jgi:hypothetical protein